MNVALVAVWNEKRKQMSAEMTGCLIYGEKNKDLLLRPGRGWWIGAVCTLLVWMPFGSFTLRELTCRHCEYLTLWTCKVLCGRFYAPYSCKSSFIQSFIQNRSRYQCNINHRPSQYKCLVMVKRLLSSFSFLRGFVFSLAFSMNTPYYAFFTILPKRDCE